MQALLWQTQGRQDSYNKNKSDLMKYDILSPLEGMAQPLFAKK